VGKVNVASVWSEGEFDQRISSTGIGWYRLECCDVAPVGGMQPCENLLPEAIDMHEEDDRRR
jgi:hypothetical protein